MTRTVYIVSCSSKQSNIDPKEKRPAKFLYLGSSFSKAYRYAMQIKQPEDDVLDHPIVKPNDMLTSYDSGDPANWRKNQQMDWAEKAMCQLSSMYYLEHTKFILVCGCSLGNYLKVRLRFETLVKGASRGDCQRKLNDLLDKCDDSCSSSENCDYKEECRRNRQKNR